MFIVSGSLAVLDPVTPGLDKATRRHSKTQCTAFSYANYLCWDRLGIFSPSASNLFTLYGHHDPPPPTVSVGVVTTPIWIKIAPSNSSDHSISLSGFSPPPGAYLIRHLYSYIFMLYNLYCFSYLLQCFFFFIIFYMPPMFPLIGLSSSPSPASQRSTP